MVNVVIRDFIFHKTEVSPEFEVYVYTIKHMIETGKKIIDVKDIIADLKLSEEEVYNAIEKISFLINSPMYKVLEALEGSVFIYLVLADNNIIKVTSDIPLNRTIFEDFIAQINEPVETDLLQIGTDVEVYVISEECVKGKNLKVVIKDGVCFVAMLDTYRNMVTYNTVYLNAHANINIKSPTGLAIYDTISSKFLPVYAYKTVCLVYDYEENRYTTSDWFLFSTLDEYVATTIYKSIMNFAISKKVFECYSDDKEIDVVHLVNIDTQEYITIDLRRLEVLSYDVGLYEYVSELEKYLNRISS